MNAFQRSRAAAGVVSAWTGTSTGDNGAVLPRRQQAGAAATDGVLAALGAATGWLNTAPLTATGLRGNVVVVNFWTYTCINWLRSLPYVRAWADRYRTPGLVVIGVHTPEFDVEKDIDNVRRAAADLRVDYPIALDSDYSIWDAFDNRYWPALYFIDAGGRIRQHRFGEGDYERSEQTIQQLLTEAGAGDIGEQLTPVDARGVEAAADWDNLRSPETYLGYGRTANFASAVGAVRDTGHVYTAPGTLRRNHWALAGDWTLRPQAAVLNRAEGRISYHFDARDLHLVMGPNLPGSTVRFRVRVDGQVPGAAAGSDVDDDGNGTVTEPRLYQLVRQPGPVTARTFEISFLDPGVRAYAFTFG